MFVLWHQSTALMPMQFAPPHPFAKANARALQSFEKKNHKCPMVGKKQGVQIPCGTYGEERGRFCTPRLIQKLLVSSQLL